MEGERFISDSSNGARLFSAMYRKCFALLALAMMPVACHGPTTAAPPLPPSSTQEQQRSVLDFNSDARVFIANSFDNSVKKFALSANDNVPPLTQIAGPATTLNGPASLTISQNVLYVTNLIGNSITEYAVNASGNASPLRTITCGRLFGPYGIVVDAGTIYVTNSAPQPAAILKFPATANGCVNNEQILAGPHTQLSSAEAILVVHHTLFVSNTSLTGGEVLEYPDSAVGDVVPSAVISGNLTELVNPQGLAMDDSGQLYVADFVLNKVLVFSNGANGNVAPVKAYDMPAQLPNPNGIALYGRLIIVTQGENNAGFVEFVKSANGNQPPLHEVVGPLTGLAFPGGVQVH